MRTRVLLGELCSFLFFAACPVYECMEECNRTQQYNIIGLSRPSVGLTLDLFSLNNSDRLGMKMSIHTREF
jgi:hypothetical protein